MRKFTKGFTLIELLIVIALLGALAVGLLAALDPFEQLKKGTDTGVRNTVSEFHGSVIRYYAIKNYMPWCVSAPGSVCGSMRDGLSADPNGTTLDSLTETISEITSVGELKDNFTGLAGGQLAKIFVTGSDDPPVIKVCYKPTAKAFISDPNTIYDEFGDDANAANCKGGGGTETTCLWCVQ